MGKDWKAQLATMVDENMRLRIENVHLKDQMEERVNQARKDERAKVAGEILAGRGGE